MRVRVVINKVIVKVRGMGNLSHGIHAGFCLLRLETGAVGQHLLNK